MTDVGSDVRIKRSNSRVVKLSETVQDMMSNWTADNFCLFEETMKQIKEGAPVQWVKLYMEAVKMGIVKQTDINININRQRDREDLQALVRTRLPSPEAGTYTSFEEVRPEPLPLKKEE